MEKMRLDWRLPVQVKEKCILLRIKGKKGVLCYQYDLIENRKENIVDEDVRGVSRIT